jgi:hypothetical protein
MKGRRMMMLKLIAASAVLTLGAGAALASEPDPN